MLAYDFLGGGRGGTVPKAYIIRPPKDEEEDMGASETLKVPRLSLSSSSSPHFPRWKRVENLF